MEGIDGWVITSKKEREVVDAMREKLQDLAGEVDETHNLKDSCLVRYARVRHLKVDAAVKAYRNSAKWRKEEKPLETAERYSPSEVLRKYRPGGFFGTSKEGCPVNYDRLGQADPTVLNFLRKTPSIGRDASPTQQITDYEIAKAELLSQVFKECSEKAGKEIYRVFTVMDLGGLGRHHLSKNTIDLFGAIVSKLDAHYPMRFRKLVIVNAPYIFNLAWKLIKVFLHETTRAQIEVVYGPPGKVLLQHIDADQLPKAYGGNLEVNGDPYCNPPIVPGGRIPKDFVGKPAEYHEESIGLPMHLWTPSVEALNRILGADKTNSEAPSLQPEAQPVG